MLTDDEIKKMPQADFWGIINLWMDSHSAWIVADFRSGATINGLSRRYGVSEEMIEHTLRNGVVPKEFCKA